TTLNDQTAELPNPNDPAPSAQPAPSTSPNRSVRSCSVALCSCSPLTHLLPCAYEHRLTTRARTTSTLSPAMLTAETVPEARRSLPTLMPLPSTAPAMCMWPIPITTPFARLRRLG